MSLSSPHWFSEKHDLTLTRYPVSGASPVMEQLLEVLSA